MDMQRKPQPVLNQLIIKEVCERLAANKRVQRSLPGGGYLRVDRQLPFLCVYRVPAGQEDPLTSKLVRSEAAYIIIPEGKYKAKYKSLLEQIIETLSQAFGAFLLFELWSGAEVEADENVDPEALRPDFKIWADTYGELVPTCENLESGLQKIKTLKKKANAVIHYSRITRPPDMSPLLGKSRLVALQCHSLGLEVSPIYRNLEADEQFPLVFRGLHRGISSAIKQAFFEFTRNNTRQRPKHYFAMGPRAVTKAVWEIDQKLAAIGSGYDFLLLSSPINTRSSWNTFKRTGFQTAPVLHYRPLPIDPPKMKKELYSIDLERIADPTLGNLFRKKRGEIDRELTMLSERGTPNFMLGSLQLYGRVDDSIMQTAVEILERFPGRSHDDTTSGRYTATDFADRAQQEIDKYSLISGKPAVSKVIVTDEIPGLMVSQGNLLIGKSMKIPDNRMEALIQHEVGTHILSFLNGQSQPLHLLSVGLDGYDELQEGLAVLAEYLVGQLSRARIRLLAGRVVAARSIEDGASFVETYRMLERNYDFEQSTAYRITVRIFRGGGLVKDAIYLRGLVRLLNYLATDGDLDLLFTGKFALEHIPTIRELLHRNVLRGERLLPSYMEEPKAKTRLAELRKGLTPIDLITAKTRRKH